MTTVSAVAEADLLRGAAHLLRSPLGVVLNIAATLRDYDDRFTPELRATYLGEIWQAAEEMRVALDGLSLLARLTAGTLSFSPAPVPLTDLLGGAREALCSVWGAEQAPYTIRCDAEAQADPRRLAQAFEALARCCTPAGGVVLAAIEGEAPAIRLGPVTPRAAVDDLQAMLAAPVHSAEAGQWIAHSGGWALLLARHLLEAQGGRLTAEPEGNGLTYIITLTAPDR